ncbi:Uma2 family endonuclease [uncultured Enterovirga sp.]|uniref:Uma2 family endonuclease n=1 Tax=uncultured Enterovirga sp. TaxID=2026352 RepID=UPI0035CB7FB4
MSTAALRSETHLEVGAFLRFLDSRAGERWELLDGQPVLMVGGTRAHARIAGNLLEAVRPQARARRCDALAGLLVETPSGSAFEPDLLVECSPGRPQDRTTETPVIVFEVLSPSTMHFDRSEKARRYRAIPSLQQLVFVYQDSVRVESWLRQDGEWLPAPHQVLVQREDSLALPVIAGSLPLAAIYLDVVPNPLCV